MIHYKKYQNKIKGSVSKDKWFGRAVHELVEFDEFVTHMARHHCVFSEGTIRGVLIEMENCLREMLLDGKAVRFDDIGIFRIGLNTIRIQPTGTVRRAGFFCERRKSFSKICTDK